MRANDVKEGDRMGHRDDVLMDGNSVCASTVRDRKEKRNGKKRNNEYS